MLKITNIRIAVKYRYTPGFGTHMKGLISASIQSDNCSAKDKTMAFSGITEWALTAKILDEYQKITSNDEVLEILKNISVSKLESNDYYLRPGMIDTQLSELKLFSCIMLSLRFPLGNDCQNKTSYSVFDIPLLTFEEESIYSIYAIREDSLQYNIKKQVGNLEPQLLLREEAQDEK